MKRTILLWLLTAMLLWGCTAAPEATESGHGAGDQTLPPESTLEQQTEGAVLVYPLDISDCHGIAVMGDGLLVFSEEGSGTRLTLLSGEDLDPSAELTVDTGIFTDQASTQVTGEGISFFDEVTRETVVLDEDLREITRIPGPEGLIGVPLLSSDRLSLFYGTAEGLWVLDLETGLPRLLRRHTAELVPQKLLMNDTVLQCSEHGADEIRTLFLSLEAGQILKEISGTMKTVSSGQRYMAVSCLQEQRDFLFGTGSGVPQTLHTGSEMEYWLLPESDGVLGVSEEELRFFDLSSGLLRSSLKLTQCHGAADGGNGVVWLLDRENTLYRWDTHALPSGDETVYSGIYYTRSNPDLAGITRCQALAEEIGARHGIKVLVWEDAIAVQPWDYRLTEEYQAPVLQEQLRLLDQRLGNFPEGFLAQMAEAASGLTICLVQNITGDADYGSLEVASGTQFWVEDHAYIALSTVNATEGSLYHELCHVFDTRVIARCSAYDQWEELNPSGFQYDYDYARNATRNAGEYLREAERCFIDTYSMSFPKEDRARVLEYAMTPGNESYFRSEVMQAKLRQICIGLREAFGLKKSGETFLWEQYLNESLAYTK